MLDKFILIAKAIKNGIHIVTLGRPSDLEYFTCLINLSLNEVVIERGKFFVPIKTDMEGLRLFFESKNITIKEVFG